LESLGALVDANLGCVEAADLSPLGGASKLRSLNLSKGALCSKSQRAALSLNFASDLTSLRNLELGAVGFVTDLSPLAGLKRLEKLGLRGLELDNIGPLSGLTQLRDLVLTQNPVSDLSPLSELPHLRQLHLASGELSNLAALAQILTLEDLDLSFNEIQNISALTNLSGLKFLDLAGNSISDIAPLDEMKNLIVTDLSNNDIDDLGPLAGNLFFSGGQLWISDNEFSCEDAADDLLSLKARGVSVFDDCP
jgi:internalin A